VVRVPDIPFRPLFAGSSVCRFQCDHWSKSKQSSTAGACFVGCALHHFRRSRGAGSMGPGSRREPMQILMRLNWPTCRGRTSRSTVKL